MNLYQAQKMSEIQVNPISFMTFTRPKTNEHMARLYYSIINYTGFRASNVRVDAKFSSNSDWIHEWIAVAAEGLESMKKNGELLTEDQKIELDSYKKNIETFASERLDMEPDSTGNGSLQGAFKYQPDKENVLKIRLSWESENNAHFDKIFIFKLGLTEAYGARSFIVIPITN